jgi:Leucine-rich repeat (LRR) protein
MLRRFALATFYYATGGNDSGSWKTTTGWLDPAEHECLWHGVSCANGTSDVLALCQSELNLPSASCQIRDKTGTMMAGLDLSANGLQRSLPREIGLLQTSNITVLKLENNKLAGSVPREIRELAPSLRVRSLFRNKFDGTVSTAIGDLTQLETLFLNENELTGTIPAALTKLVNLVDLDLGQNSIAGTIPARIGLLSALTSAVLSRNALTGTLPPELAQLTSLVVLDLSGNDLDLAFPDGIGTAMRSLQVLALSENARFGDQTIPTQIGDLTSLTRLELFSSGLSGTIPTELGRLEYLQYLRLRRNVLTGTIPTELGSLRNLVVWDTGGNMDMTGSLPAELAGLGALEEFAIAGNRHSGPIPPEYGNWTTLVVWDTARNYLTDLPTELGHLTALEELTAPGTFRAFERQPAPRTAHH